MCVWHCQRGEATITAPGLSYNNYHVRTYIHKSPIRNPIQNSTSLVWREKRGGDRHTMQYINNQFGRRRTHRRKTAHEPFRSNTLIKKNSKNLASALELWRGRRWLAWNIKVKRAWKDLSGVAGRSCGCRTTLTLLYLVQY